VTEVKPYHLLARYYDEIFGGLRAPIDATRERILEKVLRNAQSACDLACGTGQTALWFARRGVRTFAVDLSPSMVRATREKVRAAGLPVRVLRGDMRSFRLPEPVDLVTCECDAVNHVPRRGDLAKVAGAVWRALQPGGHFYFDVNNSLGFRRYWDRDVWVETRNACVVMRNGHSPAADRAWSDVEWFLRDGGHWRRRRERVEEVCWTGAEIRTALREAGFDRVREFDGASSFEGSPLIVRGCRSIYLARKAPRGPYDNAIRN
jgi:SAM-dependent methyltransferase